MNDTERRDDPTAPLRVEVLEDRLAAAGFGSWGFGGWGHHSHGHHRHWTPPAHSRGWDFGWGHGRCGKGHQPPSPPPAVQTGGVAGVVYLDANGNNTRDANESGVGGQVVWADANNNGVRDAGEANTTTAADGTYTLAGLTAGTAVVVRSVQPDGSPTGGQSVTPTAGQTLHGVDIGLNDSNAS